MALAERALVGRPTILFSQDNGNGGGSDSSSKEKAPPVKKTLSELVASIFKQIEPSKQPGQGGNANGHLP